LSYGVGEGLLLIELKFAFFLVVDGVVPLPVGIETEDEVVFEVE
jgi:hypothetical protein